MIGFDTDEKITIDLALNDAIDACDRHIKKLQRSSQTVPAQLWSKKARLENCKLKLWGKKPQGASN